MTSEEQKQGPHWWTQDSELPETLSFFSLFSQNWQLQFTQYLLEQLMKQKTLGATELFCRSVLPTTLHLWEICLLHC